MNLKSVSILKKKQKTTILDLKVQNGCLYCRFENTKIKMLFLTFVLFGEQHKHLYSLNIYPLAGRRDRTLPHSDPSSTGFCELLSPCTCSSSCSWFWPAWCLSLKRTTAVHWPTTLPDLSTPCCTTPTAPHPHDHCHTLCPCSPYKGIVEKKQKQPYSGGKNPK